MASYKTPDVYIQERSIFPPSVAEVATAIPAFLGRTELAVDSKNTSLIDKPTRITSMVEFESLFGGPKMESFLVDENGLLDANADPLVYDNAKKIPDFLLYQSLQHFFANGGGACYVVTLGTYANYDLATEADAFNSALDAVAMWMKSRSLSAPMLCVWAQPTTTLSDKMPLPVRQTPRSLCGV